MELMKSWKKDKDLVHGPNFLSLSYDFSKSKYTINQTDNEPHIILSNLCIVSQTYIRQAYEYILDIQDIFQTSDHKYTSIDICLSILTACKHSSNNRINGFVEDIKWKIIGKQKPNTWSKDIYSDICTLTIKKYFNNKTIETAINPKYPKTLVVLPFFNFAGFSRLYTNIHDAVFKFNSQNVNIIVSEAVLEGYVSNMYTVPCKILTTETNTIAFHKEGLFNKVFHTYKHLYDYFVLCDSDIIFADDNWVDKMQKMFETGVEVAQPYSICHWTDKSGKTVGSNKSYSFIRAEKTTQDKITDTMFKKIRQCSYPGFVWAFTKSFLERTNGIYSKCFTGSGDEMVILLAEGLPSDSYSYIYLQPDLNEFLVKGGGKHGAMIGEIYHLFHGNTKYRRYYERHKTIISANINLGPEYFSEYLEDHLIKANHPKVNEINLEYFKGRREDD